MSAQMPVCTHQEGLNFECARDLMGILNAEIAGEQDLVRVQSLRDRHHALFEEGASLHVQNQDNLIKTIQKYSDIVRAEYESHKISVSALPK